MKAFSTEGWKIIHNMTSPGADEAQLCYALSGTISLEASGL